MKVERLMDDLKTRFCVQLMNVSSSYNEKRFAKKVDRILSSDNAKIFIQGKVPRSTMLAAKTRMAVMNMRAYPKFLNNVDRQVRPIFSEHLVELLEQTETMQSWKKDLIGRV